MGQMEPMPTSISRPKRVRMGFERAQVAVVQALEGLQVGKVHHVDADLVTVVQVLGGVPSLRPNRVDVYPKLHTLASMSGRARLYLFRLGPS